MGRSGIPGRPSGTDGEDERHAGAVPGGSFPLGVDIDEQALTLTWDDGRITRLSLVDLRRRCPCVRCRDLREEGKPVWPRPGVPGELRVERADPAGAWGLWVRWNDRHEAGIYPWELLRSW